MPVITVMDYYMAPKMPVMLVKVIVEEADGSEHDEMVRVYIPKLLKWWINFLLGRAIEHQIE